MGVLDDVQVRVALTVPALIVKILAPKRYKLKTVQKKMYICQNCGHSWNAWAPCRPYGRFFILQDV